MQGPTTQVTVPPRSICSWPPRWCFRWASWHCYSEVLALAATWAKAAARFSSAAPEPAPSSCGTTGLRHRATAADRPRGECSAGAGNPPNRTRSGPILLAGHPVSMLSIFACTAQPPAPDGLLFGLTYFCSVLAKNRGVLLAIGIVVAYQIAKAVVKYKWPSITLPDLTLTEFSMTPRGHRALQEPRPRDRASLGGRARLPIRRAVAAAAARHRLARALKA